MPTQLTFNPKMIPELKRDFTLIIIFCMLMNLEHSATLYYDVSKKNLAEIFGWEYADRVYSILVIVVIDYAIISWFKINRYWEAAVVALVVISLNLLYYEWPGIFTENTNKRIAQFIFSCMGGFIIISFSYLKAKVSEAELKVNELPEEHLLKLQEQESRINDLESKLNQEIESNKKIGSVLNHQVQEKESFKSEIHRLNSELNEAMEKLIQKEKIENELQSLKKKDESSRTCEYCQEVLDTIDSKRVHKGQCIKNPKNQGKRNNEIHVEKGKS